MTGASSQCNNVKNFSTLMHNTRMEPFSCKIDRLSSLYETLRSPSMYLLHENLLEFGHSLSCADTDYRGRVERQIFKGAFESLLR